MVKKKKSCRKKKEKNLLKNRKSFINKNNK